MQTWYSLLLGLISWDAQNLFTDILPFLKSKV